MVQRLSRSLVERISLNFPSTEGFFIHIPAVHRAYDYYLFSYVLFFNLQRKNYLWKAEPNYPLCILPVPKKT